MESLSFPRAPRRYRVRCDNIVAATNLSGSVGVLTPTRGFAIPRVTPIGAAVLDPFASRQLVVAEKVRSDSGRLSTVEKDLCLMMDLFQLSAVTLNRLGVKQFSSQISWPGKATPMQRKHAVAAEIYREKCPQPQIRCPIPHNPEEGLSLHCTA